MKVLVVGLGLFGAAVAEALARAGVEVLAIDSDEGIVQRVADRRVVGHAVSTDATDRANLERLGVGPEYDAAVVAVGGTLEAGVLVTIHLEALGVKRILAKATHPTHQQILEKVGADETLIPEVRAAAAVARSIADPDVIAELDLAAEYSIVEVAVPRTMVGKSLVETALRSQYRANVLGIRRGGKVRFEVTGSTRFEAGDTMVVGVSRSDRGKLVELVRRER